PLTGHHAEDDVGLVAGRKAEEEVLRVRMREEPEPLETLLGREDGPGVLQLRCEEAPLAGALDGRGHAPPPPLAVSGRIAPSTLTLLPPGGGRRTSPRAG